MSNPLSPEAEAMYFAPMKKDAIPPTKPKSQNGYVQEPSHITLERAAAEGIDLFEASTRNLAEFNAEELREGRFKDLPIGTKERLVAGGVLRRVKARRLELTPYGEEILREAAP